MKYHTITKLPIFLITIIFIISFSLISTHEGGIQIRSHSVLAKGKKSGPPQHAKAHGYRAKHTYRYYPAANAYYDVERKSYFYLEGTNWRVGVSLPDNLNVRLGNYVTIGMDSDKPYTSFEEHKRQY
jgi:hypothetical protein